jgi:hypothetical protein
MPWKSQHIRAGWLALCLIAQARGQYRFDAWTADNGLPQNVIRDVCQTRDGYLWVATLNGLARFDGVRFTVFDHTNSPGIESNRFTSLFQDIDGDLWLGTESSGVTHYHRGVFTTYTTIQGLPYNAVSGTTGDASGHLWVLSHDRIMEWKQGSARFVDVTPKDLPKIPFEPYHWEGGGFWAADSCRAGRLPAHEGPDEALTREQGAWDAAKKRPKYPDAKSATSSTVAGREGITYTRKICQNDA